MADVEELQQRIEQLEMRIVALEKAMFSERHGASETRAANAVPSGSRS